MSLMMIERPACAPWRDLAMENPEQLIGPALAASTSTPADRIAARARGGIG
jgi:hypothetical protein